MRRREFIAGVGGAAAAWPLAVRAQQTTLPVHEWLSGGSPGAAKYSAEAFLQGLRATGYVPG
jgi:putative tryptophan/tyrosine transport system substrate-binding protein